LWAVCFIATGYKIVQEQKNPPQIEAGCLFPEKSATMELCWIELASIWQVARPCKFTLAGQELKAPFMGLLFFW
jgi:hypothetical protein